MGSGGPSIQNVILAADKTREKNPKKMGPFVVPRTMSSTASATLAVHLKLKVLTIQLVLLAQPADIVSEMQWN